LLGFRARSAQRPEGRSAQRRGGGAGGGRRLDINRGGGRRTARKRGEGGGGRRWGETEGAGVAGRPAAREMERSGGRVDGMLIDRRLGE
jgi:hypothetical protein